MNIGTILGALLLVASSSANKLNEKGKPTVDLEDYIDTGSSKNKNEDLGTSATGYYGHGHQPHVAYHGHSAYQHHPVSLHHGSYGHGHHPYGYDHGLAQSYFTGEYGGFGHVGSAHVSYGTEINHGHSHHHHHAHSYHG